MNRGIRVSAAALTPLARAQEILANNLANVSTTGFREDRVGFERLLATTAQPGTGGANAGVQPGGAAPTGAGATGGPNAAGALGAAPALGRKVDLEAGALDTTGGPLDLAIVGPGFFTVQTPDGPAYTRDGSFSLDAEGQLVHRSGNPLMGEGGPITLAAGSVFEVDTDGTVRVDGEAQGRLQVVSFTDPTTLRHAGRGLLASDVPGEPLETARVVQGSLESSNVDPVGTMVEMMTVLRSFEANHNALMTQDQTLAQLVRWAST